MTLAHNGHYGGEKKLPLQRQWHQLLAVAEGAGAASVAEGSCRPMLRGQGVNLQWLYQCYLFPSLCFPSPYRFREKETSPQPRPSPSFADSGPGFLAFFSSFLSSISSLSTEKKEKVNTGKFLLLRFKFPQSRCHGTHLTRSLTRPPCPHAFPDAFPKTPAQHHELPIHIHYAPRPHRPHLARTNHPAPVFSPHPSRTIAPCSLSLPRINIASSLYIGSVAV